MTKVDEVAAAFLPFCREAYADGPAGKGQAAWEHFGEESIKALYEITEKKPSAASVRFIRMVADECERLWEKGAAEHRHLDAARHKRKAVMRRGQKLPNGNGRRLGMVSWKRYRGGGRHR